MLVIVVVVMVIRDVAVISTVMLMILVVVGIIEGRLENGFNGSNHIHVRLGTTLFSFKPCLRNLPQFQSNEARKRVGVWKRRGVGGGGS